MRKYRKNPAVPGSVCINGTDFSEHTIVSGEQWERYLRSMFPGRPAMLVLVTDAEWTEQFAPIDPVAPAAPLGVRALISTARRGVEEAPEYGDHPPPGYVEPEEEDDELEDEVIVEDEPPVVTMREIPNVGDGRARALEKAGYKDVAGLASADPQDVVKRLKAVGTKISLAVSRQVVADAARMLTRR